MTVTAFDSDVLIYAIQKGHPLGAPVAAHIHSSDTIPVGSLILVPEVLTKPRRESPQSDETAALGRLISRIDLRPLDKATAQLSLDLAVAYKLRAADAAHLATAVMAGADYFLTNNREDFPKSIQEIEIIYPEDLADLT